MQHIENFGDERNQGWCVFCGGPDETRDHVPSRVLLDEPYPPHLPVVPACVACNGSFSRDEEYLACLIECALTGSVEAAKARAKIDGILTRAPALASRLNAARREENGRTTFSAETDRVRTVVLKLAKGHVAYEQNEPQRDDPVSISFAPFTALDEEQRASFERGAGEIDAWPEVGSQAMQRFIFGHNLVESGWIEVQPEQYRYRVEYQGGCRVQMVFREFLAAEVVWEERAAERV